MLSVTILTYNAQRHLARVLDSVSSFDDIVLLDSGSTDATCEIAACYPQVRVFSRRFDGFGEAHQFATLQAKHDWILSLDSDEVLSETLLKELQNLQLDPHCVYAFPSHNIFRGKWIRWGGWAAKTPTRIYNRLTTSFSLDKVHERVLSEGLKTHVLSGHISHYSYDNMSDFLIKMERYSSLFAEQKKGKKKVTLWTAISHSLGAFFKSYILQKGFLAGAEGFIISSYMAHTSFYKYLKLQEINHATYAHVSPSRDRETHQLPASTH